MPRTGRNASTQKYIHILIGLLFVFSFAATASETSDDDSDDDSDDSDDDSSESEAAPKQNQSTEAPGKSSDQDLQSRRLTKWSPGDHFVRRPKPNGRSVADGASSHSSDMELPALVSAAIQRVAESGSDGEVVRPVHYTSSLLRDFVAKTQMLGSKLTSQSSDVELPAPVS